MSPLDGRRAHPFSAAMSDTKDLPEAAKRALAEAEARRAAIKAEKDEREQGGPKGPEPTRYGDWERKGVCVDF